MTDPEKSTAVKILRLEMQRSTLTDWLAGPNVTERGQYYKYSCEKGTTNCLRPKK